MNLRDDMTEYNEGTALVGRNGSSRYDEHRAPPPTCEIRLTREGSFSAKVVSTCVIFALVIFILTAAGVVIGQLARLVGLRP